MMENMLHLMIEGVLIPIVATFGLCGNIASVIVLRSTKLDMKWSFRCLLMMLAMFDTIFIVCLTISFSLPRLWTTWQDTIHPHIFPWLLPFLQMSLNGSIWSIVAVAVERVASVVFSLRNRSFSSPTLTYIMPVVTLTMVWNIPRFNEVYTCHVPQVTTQMDMDNITSPVQLKTESPIYQPTNASEFDIDSIYHSLESGGEEIQMMQGNASDSLVLGICPTELRSNVLYTQYYILLGNFVLMVFIPLVLLIILNGYLYKVIIRKRIIRSSSRHTRDQKIAMILVTIVIIFFVCSIPRLIINSYEVFHLLVKKDLMNDWPEWCDTVSILSHLLLVLNSSVNIVIYTAKDEKFKRILFKTVGIKKKVDQKKVIRNRLMSYSSRISSQLTGQETDSSMDSNETIKTIKTTKTIKTIKTIKNNNQTNRMSNDTSVTCITELLPRNVEQRMDQSRGNIKIIVADSRLDKQERNYVAVRR